jgi:lysophospholipase L1-like esterase
MKIVCFGDSNTYGYDPRSYFGERYDPETIWVNILAEKLGSLVVNAGENGREIPHNNCDLREFDRSLNLEKPFDLLIIMLGTNDLLQGNSVSEIIHRMKVFLERTEVCYSEILLVTPPVLKPGVWVDSNELIDRSVSLNHAYKSLADTLGLRFVDINSLDISIAFDGVHLTQEGHSTLAACLFDYFIKGD